MDSYTASELPMYKYAPLSTPDHLRVLWLRPAGDEEEDIDCDIVEISLRDRPYDEAAFDGEYDSFVDEDHGESQVNDVMDSLSLPSLVQFLDSDSEGDVNSLRDIRSASSDTSDTSNRDKLTEIASYEGRQYEAVSWCWGQTQANQILRVHNRYGVFALLIFRTLRNAL
jgi:hypothetical protein